MEMMTNPMADEKKISRTLRHTPSLMGDHEMRSDSTSPAARGGPNYGLFAMGAVVFTLGIVVGIFGATVMEETMPGFANGVKSQSTTVNMEVFEASSSRRRRLGGGDGSDDPFNSVDLSAITHLMVTKEDGAIRRFEVASYNLNADDTLVFYGTDGCFLLYSGDGKPTLDCDIAESRVSSSQEVSRRRLSDGESARFASSEPPREGSEESRGRRLSQSSYLCDEHVDSNCRTCINSQDNWCEVNTWDSFCKSGCDGPTTYMPSGCALECAEPKVTDVTGETEEKQTVNLDVDCQVSQWGSWGACTFSTGSSVCSHSHSRSIFIHPQGNGNSCPSLEETAACSCPAYCGDGHVVSPEECDDGGYWGNDGCDMSCKIEKGWECQGDVATKSTCEAVSCGDGQLAGSETCDDGNTDDYDGCSSTCQVESFYTCTDYAGYKSDCSCMRVRKDWRDLRGTVDDCMKFDGEWTCGDDSAYFDDGKLYIENEKATFFEAVNQLKDTIVNGQSLYDTFVHIHSHGSNREYSHGTSGFLPWHRKFLLEFENALRSLDDRFQCVTVPYWDWAEDTDICASQAGCSTYASFNSVPAEFGGAGDHECARSGDGPVACSAAGIEREMHGTYVTHGSTGAPAVECGWWARQFNSDCQEVPAKAIACVTSGPFAGWLTPDWPDSQNNPGTTPQCLSRGVNWDIGANGGLTGSLRLREIITANTEYGGSGNNGFRAYIESTPHAGPHNLLGGHLRSFSSPADPLYFVHHSFIDKIWDMWQNCHNYDHLDGYHLSSKHYDSKKGASIDGIDTPLHFMHPHTMVDSVNHCLKKDTTGCARCVHNQDMWCLKNNWDDACYKFCGAICSDECIGGAIGVDEIPVSTTHIPTWNEDTLSVRDFWSVHNIDSVTESGGDSYFYASDQFDQNIKTNDAICDMKEEAHHGQLWKGPNRRRTAEDMRAHRQLADYADNGACYYAGGCGTQATGLLASCVPIEGLDLGDGSGRAYGDLQCCANAADGSWQTVAVQECSNAAGDVVDCYSPGSASYFEGCECSVGYWQGSGCVTLAEQAYDTADPDVLLIADYFNELESTLAGNSEYVSAKDKNEDILGAMTQRECKLLYSLNKNLASNAAEYVDDVACQEGGSVACQSSFPQYTCDDDDITNCCTENDDGSWDCSSLTSTGETAFSEKARFLSNWNLDDEISTGVADDPCGVEDYYSQETVRRRRRLANRRRKTL